MNLKQIHKVRKVKFLRLNTLHNVVFANHVHMAQAGTTPKKRHQHNQAGFTNYTRS